MRIIFYYVLAQSLPLLRPVLIVGSACTCSKPFFFLSSVCVSDSWLIPFQLGELRYFTGELSHWVEMPWGWTEMRGSKWTRSSGVLAAVGKQWSTRVWWKLVYDFRQITSQVGPLVLSFSEVLSTLHILNFCCSLLLLITLSMALRWVPLNGSGSASLFPHLNLTTGRCLKLNRTFVLRSWVTRWWTGLKEILTRIQKQRHVT